MKKPDRPRLSTKWWRRKGAENKIIAEAMNITVRYVQKLWARFKNYTNENVVFPARMGRPPRGLTTRSERPAALNTHCALKSSAGQILDRIRRSGTAVPKGLAHTVLQESVGAVGRKRKQARRKRILYELSTPMSCGILTTSGWTTGAGSHRA